jgi:hypothetical protein
MVTTMEGGPLIAGQPNQLNLSTGDPNIALDGAMLYAKTANLKRIGSFFDPSGIFMDFPGCGRNPHGKHAGVIHQQVITCNVSLQIPLACLLEVCLLTNLFVTGILHRPVLLPAKM